MKVRIPLCGLPNQRQSSTTKDQKFTNCFVEVVVNPVTQTPKVFLMKRPGLVSAHTTTGATGEARGIYYWNGNYYTVYGNKVYKDTTAIVTLTTTTGKVGFTECVDANVSKLFFCDGTNGYIVTSSGTVTQVTDADFPSPHTATPVYMDGYIFLVKPSTNEIYNSNLEAPLSWNATDFISAEMYPDGVVTLGRQTNQLVVFGTKTIEFFYDAGNATGSPLARTDQYVQQQGIASKDSLDSAEGILAWVSQSDAGQRYIVAMEGFTPKKISTEPIDRLLNSDPNITTSRGALVRIAGHLMYVLSTDSMTLAYDFQTTLWYFFTSGNQPIFFGKWAAEVNGDCVWQLHSGNSECTMSQNTFQDIGTDFNVDIQTSIIDMDTMQYKQLTRVEVIGDWQVGSSGTVTLSMSDDDYNTWKLTRSFPIASRMYGWRWGQFRRRAFKLSFIGNSPLRLEALELDINVGST